jgi:hypothetical protein
MMEEIEFRSNFMKYVIFDCDNTAGLPGKPMDDALALLYLLGRPQKAEILALPVPLPTAQRRRFTAPPPHCSGKPEEGISRCCGVRTGEKIPGPKLPGLSWIPSTAARGRSVWWPLDL